MSSFLINTRALFHDGSIEYTMPLEPKPGEHVRFLFRTAKDDVDHVFFCMGPNQHEMTKKYNDRIFSYYEYVYLCTKDMIKYHFRVEKENDFYIYDMAGVHRDMAGNFEFALSPGFQTPFWAKGAVMYQIYVDRFCNGDKSNDVETNEYNYVGDKVHKVESWDRLPASMDVREFYGGDLQGVLNKLDYLEKLGVEVIYFNPLFVSPSNHKYDIQDYDYIDPHFGRIVEDGGELLKPEDTDNSHATKYIKRVTDKANLEASNEFFAHVVSEVHKRGMKVILDGVFNHCGSFNKWMDREKLYKGQPGYEDGAYVSENSPYHSFFQFHEEGEWPDNNCYDGWWGFDTLPKLNYEGSRELYEYIMYIGRKWVSPPYNADGWRLDVAADLGYSQEFNHKFWREFRANVKRANPNAIILAEHYGDPSPWLMGDQWDTVMNYDAFMEPISWFLTGMEKHSDSFQEGLLGNINAFSMSMQWATARFLQPSLMVAMNELSNHDHSRFLTRTNHVAGRTATSGPEKASEGVDKAVLKEAVVMQMTWPGAPTIYYGEEAGLCGWTDPDNRRTYPWGHEDVELIEFYREMISIHKSNPALRYGATIPMQGEFNVVVYGRMLKENIIIIAVNNNDEAKQIEIPIWMVGGTDHMQAIRIMESTREFYNVGRIPYWVEDGLIAPEIQGKSACVYRLQLTKEYDYL